MCTNITMAMAIPNKPAAHYICSSFEKKASKKLCCVSSVVVGGLRCSAHNKPNCDTTVTRPERRSGNYGPSLWDFDYIQSLRSDEYTEEEKPMKRVVELIDQVNMLLEKEQILSMQQKLELIDDLSRMGISYHFQDKINKILNSLYYYYGNNNNNHNKGQSRDLYYTALEFRLLRQHGFSVSQEVFDCFKSERGDFEPRLGDDTKGLLQLYEASFLLTEGEETLELAREFSTNLLRKKIDDDHDDDNNNNNNNNNLNINDKDILLLVRHALALPLHWRIQRPNARWFIDAYERRSDMNPVVLELAKLDFNVVQATHLQELKHITSWWKQTCLAEKLPFARDRMVECYLWTIGGLFEPQYSFARTTFSKVNILVTIIDDIFDVYGTMEELQLFNNIVQRWEIEAVEKLPQHMQICFLALNNFIDETAYQVLKEQGILIIQHLRKSWADLCKSYIQEAEWYSRGYKPTLEEYINNAWISVGAHIILSHIFFTVTNPIEKEAIESLYGYHNIVRWSATLLRLANDLGTSPDEMKRGDVPKSIQCYMNETGADTEEARKYIWFKIHETWKKMNEELRKEDCWMIFQQDFVRSAVDLGRMALYMYEHGDGHGILFDEMEDRIPSLLFEAFDLQT